MIILLWASIIFFLWKKSHYCTLNIQFGLPTLISESWQWFKHFSLPSFWAQTNYLDDAHKTVYHLNHHFSILQYAVITGAKFYDVRRGLSRILRFLNVHGQINHMISDYKKCFGGVNWYTHMYYVPCILIPIYLGLKSTSNVTTRRNWKHQHLKILAFILG